jgi:predicted nucleotidyltransferase
MDCHTPEQRSHDMSRIRSANTLVFGVAEDLRALLGRSVDLAERKAVETSRNYIGRDNILAKAELIYGKPT